jgi:hypothetical protein
MSKVFDGAINRSTDAQTLDGGQHSYARIDAPDTLGNRYRLIRATSITDYN